MLIETGDSISSIAYQMGFDEITNLTRFYRQATGVTPTGFRKKHGK
jgi:AraC-like DNA-binding protein